MLGQSSSRTRSQAEGGRRNEQGQQQRRGLFIFASSTSLLQCFLASSDVGSDLGRTRTCNPRLRGPMPYPLSHEAAAFLFFLCVQCHPVIAKPFLFIFEATCNDQKSNSGHAASRVPAKRLSPVHRGRTEMPLAQAVRIQMPHASIHLILV